MKKNHPSAAKAVSFQKFATEMRWHGIGWRRRSLQPAIGMRSRGH